MGCSCYFCLWNLSWNFQIAMKMSRLVLSTRGEVSRKGKQQIPLLSKRINANNCPPIGILCSCLQCAQAACCEGVQYQYLFLGGSCGRMERSSCLEPENCDRRDMNKQVSSSVFGVDCSCQHLLCCSSSPRILVVRFVAGIPFKSTSSKEALNSHCHWMSG